MKFYIIIIYVAVCLLSGASQANSSKTENDPKIQDLNFQNRDKLNLDFNSNSFNQSSSNIRSLLFDEAPANTTSKPDDQIDLLVTDMIKGNNNTQLRMKTSGVNASINLSDGLADSNTPIEETDQHPLEYMDVLGNVIESDYDRLKELSHEKKSRQAETSPTDLLEGLRNEADNALKFNEISPQLDEDNRRLNDTNPKLAMSSDAQPKKVPNATQEAGITTLQSTGPLHNVMSFLLSIVTFFTAPDATKIAMIAAALLLIHLIATFISTVRKKS
ncbi:hypothetical protein [Thalassotalea maritima]|uniref:hypothetical protein n=1 Tax=Thalassotalea maritima TaxID=3242416 RepID=UPI0035278A18